MMERGISRTLLLTVLNMVLNSIWESVAKALKELAWIKEIAKKQLMVCGVHVWKVSETECIELGNT